MTRRTKLERILAGIGLAVAMSLVVIGAVISHKAYDPGTEEFGIVAFTRISDRQLVEDATFSGVLRKGDRLYSTYDRAVPKGKRACPT
jgi:hypothetical protein